MAIELAEIAAGFPLAASFAIAGGIAALREGRRRTALNEAMHELRRPLQALALSLPADSDALDSSLRMASAALERLDREINGGGPPGERKPVALREVVAAAAERGRARAATAGRSLTLRWRLGDPLLEGDAIELGQALDNLISNGFDHGTGPVVVEAVEDGGLLRVSVLDCGRPGPSPRAPVTTGLRSRIAGRSRHGHGLAVVRRAARRHGGSFRLRRTADGTEARLELPAARAR